jgi:DNA polymerase-3 subunit delta'
MLAPVVSGKSIKRAKIAVGPIREIIHRFALRPLEATRRVAIISNFELAGSAAADALLKTLEEPPGNAVIILTAEKPAGLPPTVVSRCALMTLRPLPRLLVKKSLSEYWGATENQAELLAHISGGRLGWAVEALRDQSMLEARAEHLDRLWKILRASSVDRFMFAEDFSKDLGPLLTALDLWASWWRDVVHVASGACTTITNTDRIRDVSLAADQLTAKEAASAVTSVLRAQEHIGRNANVRLALDVLLLDLPRINLE